MNQGKNFNIDTGLEELEKIVQELEGNKLPLEEGIKKFEQGVQVYKNCKKSLDVAEKKIAILLKDLEEENYEENIEG